MRLGARCKLPIEYDGREVIHEELQICAAVLAAALRCVAPSRKQNRHSLETYTRLILKFLIDHCQGCCGFVD
jgi:hypothetical protein